MEHDRERTLELFELVEDCNLKGAQVERAMWLLENGADPNCREPEYPFETTLCRVLEGRDKATRMKLVRALVAHGADLDLPKDIFYPLRQAVQAGDPELVQLFLDHNVQKGLDDALQRAIEKNQLEMVRALIPRVQDLEPYFAACCEAYRCRNRKKPVDPPPGLASAKLLLASGGKEGLGASLVPAIQVGFIELVTLLVEHGAALESASAEVPVLFHAATVEMARALLDAGADLHARDAHGNTVLSHQFLDAKMEMVEFYIEQGVDRYAVDEEGATAFHKAARYESPKLLEQLLPHYDLDKCNQILPLLEYLEDAEPHVRRYVADKLGIAAATGPSEREPLVLADLVTPEGKAIHAELEQRAQTLYDKLLQADPEMADLLPTFEAFFAPAVFEDLGQELQASAAQWQDCATPIQALYMEYGGEGVSPFDSGALFWGYGRCDDTLTFAEELFERGGLGLGVFFDQIGEVLEAPEPLASASKEYFQLLAFRYVHLAFGRFTRSEAFGRLPVARPLYLIGAVHDGTKTLIYKLP